MPQRILVSQCLSRRTCLQTGNPLPELASPTMPTGSSQDEWRATSSLTLTLGVRYDFETYPESLGLHADLNNWQPRAGFAYAFNKHGVIRGGFGIYNDRLVSSIGQTFDNVQWLSAGNQANAQVLFSG